MQAQVRYQETAQKPGIVFARTNELIRPLHEALPFELTGAQARVLREIYADMSSKRRMNRLVQGDVGSGKTIVALFAMLLAVESGRQAVLMAPTELLAEQHSRRMTELVEPLGLTVQVLTGQLGAAERRRALGALSDGTAVHTFTHSNPVRKVALSSTGRFVFTASHQQLVAIWDGASGSRLHTLTTKNEGITSARYSPDESLLLIGYVNRAVELWDVTSGKRLHRWTTEARNLWHPTGSAILAVGFGATPKRYYALAGDGRLMLLNRS